MAPTKTKNQNECFSRVPENTRREATATAAGGTTDFPSRPGRTARNMTSMAVHRPQRHPSTQEKGGDRAVVPYSTPETGFRGYTFEVDEALKDVQREVKGGAMGAMRAAAVMQRAQQQREEAFRLWLSEVMKKERAMAKRAAFTMLKRRDQMLQEVGPDWYQQLSWDQMETVNQLQVVHRADADEGGTARVSAWCSRLGISPVPSGRQITRALRRQPDDHEQFLLALYAVISASGKVPVPGDPPAPKLRTGFEYTPSERLLLSALTHLRLPHVVAKLEEKFGAPETRPRYLRIAPEGPPRAVCSERTLWPYLEPLPIPQTDWLELFSANNAAHSENLYMRSHLLPSTLVEELIPQPELEVPRVTPTTRASARPAPAKRRRKRKDPQEGAGLDEPTGVPPTADGPAGQGSAAETSSRQPRPRSRPRPVPGGPRVMPNWTSTPSSPCRPLGQPPSRKASRQLDVDKKHSGTVGRHPQREQKDAGEAEGSDEETRAPGVDPASVESFLASLGSEGDPLCQLPDVLRIPALQKWMRLRNGLVYVHRKLAEVLQDRSLIMWNANHLGMAYRVPTPKHGLTPQQVRELTWDRREWYRRRVDRIMSGYNKALRTIQVNAAREMFPAMACDYFPGRNKFLRTYFAYMPKHEMDTLVVKPWGNSEYKEHALRLWRERYYESKSKT